MTTFATFASKWMKQGSVNAWLNIDDGGAESWKVTYNLSDYKGDFDFPKRKTKKLSAIWDTLCAARDEAMQEARHKKAYADARRRGKPGGKFEYAFLATWGRGGTTVYLDSEPGTSSRLQGYGFSADELAEIDALGIPFIDSRPIGDDKIMGTISFPMPPSKLDDVDPAPWGPLSHAPIDVLAGLYASIGATVRNIAPRMPSADEVRGATLKEATALVGWNTGNTAMVGAALSM